MLLNFPGWQFFLTLDSLFYFTPKHFSVCKTGSFNRSVLSDLPLLRLRHKESLFLAINPVPVFWGMFLIWAFLSSFLPSSLTNPLQLPLIELSSFRLSGNRKLNRKKLHLIFIGGYNYIFSVCHPFPSKVANLQVFDATGTCLFALCSVSDMLSYIMHKTVIIQAYLPALITWSLRFSRRAVPIPHKSTL